MLLNLFTATILYCLLLGFGHMMCFIDPVIYESIPLFLIFLIISKAFYQENCKALEGRDFILCAVYLAVLAYLYELQGFTANVDVLSFMALAVYVPFSSFAAAIRYKSLM